MAEKTNGYAKCHIESALSVLTYIELPPSSTQCENFAASLCLAHRIGRISCFWTTSCASCVCRRDEWKYIHRLYIHYNLHSALILLKYWSSRNFVPFLTHIFSIKSLFSSHVSKIGSPFFALDKMFRRDQMENSLYYSPLKRKEIKSLVSSYNWILINWSR